MKNTFSIKRTISIILFIFFIIALILTVWYLLRITQEKSMQLSQKPGQPEQSIKNKNTSNSSNLPLEPASQPATNNQQLLTNTNTQGIIIPAEKTDCPDELDTSCWNTYRNKEYGFEVKFPREWMFHERDIFSVEGNFTQVIFLNKNQNYISFNLNLFSNIRNEDDNLFSVDGFKKWHSQYLINNELVTIKTSKIGKFNIIETKEYDGINSISQYIYFFNNNSVINFRRDDIVDNNEEMIFKQILFSFKLNTYWNTYKNDDFNIQFNFPQEWKVVLVEITGESKKFLKINLNTGLKKIKNNEPLLMLLTIRKPLQNKIQEENNNFEQSFSQVQDPNFKYILKNGGIAIFEASNAYDWWKIKLSEDIFFDFSYNLNLPSFLGDDPEPMNSYISNENLILLQTNFRLIVKSIEILSNNQRLLTDNNKNSIQERIIISPTQTDCTDELDVACWNTYRNKKYSFEVKFPREWVINEEYNLEDNIFKITLNENSQLNIVINVTTDSSWKDFYKFATGEIREIEMMHKTLPAVFFSGGVIEESNYWPPSITTVVYNDKFVYKVTILNTDKIDNFIKTFLSSFQFIS